VSIGEERALEFRRLCEEDIPVLLEVEREAYPDPWTAGMFRQEITNQCSEFFLGFIDGQLAVYGGFWLIIDEAHITKVTVVPEQRQRGLGRALLDWLLTRAESMGANIARLEVRESNTPARTLYTSAHFEEIGIRRGYYAQKNEAAIVMHRYLRGA